MLNLFQVASSQIKKSFSFDRANMTILSATFIHQMEFSFRLLKIGLTLKFVSLKCVLSQSFLDHSLLDRGLLDHGFLDRGLLDHGFLDHGLLNHGNFDRGL